MSDIFSKPIAVPSWLKLAARDSNLATKDVANLLGVSNNYISVLVSEGRLLKPDVVRNRGNCRVASHFWKTSTILNFIKQHNKKFEKEDITA